MAMAYIFTDKDRRYASFQNFPKHSPISPLRLANAGFEYTGNEDEVVCSICSIRYRNWQKGADPFYIHARRSPCCTFVKNFKSMISFTRNCVQDFIIPSFSASRPAIPPFSSSLPVFCVRQKIAHLQIIWDHPNIKKILEMGYNKDIIQQAVENIKKNTDKNPEPIDLLENIWEIENTRNQAMDLSRNYVYSPSNQAHSQHQQNLCAQSISLVQNPQSPNRPTALQVKDLESPNGPTVSQVQCIPSPNVPTASQIQGSQSSNTPIVSQVKDQQNHTGPTFSLIQGSNFHQYDPLSRAESNSHISPALHSSKYDVADAITSRTLSLTPVTEILNSTLQSGTEDQQLRNINQLTNICDSAESSPQNHMKAVNLQGVKRVNGPQNATHCPSTSEMTKYRSNFPSPLDHFGSRQIPHYQLRLTLKIKRAETL